MRKWAMAVLAVMTPQAAQAMNWCGLPALIPEREADFERIKPLVEQATGCKPQPSDSAHSADWRCAADPAIADDEPAMVRLFREPGEGVSLVILKDGLQSLDILRACRPEGARDGPRFDAGNVAHRDGIDFNYGLKRLTLINLGPSSLGAVFSSTASDGFTKIAPSAIFGIKPVAYPTTAVRLAGRDPLATDVFDLVAAFQQRGSRLSSSSDLNSAIPHWAMTPPTGLPGVTRVEITGFVRHLLHADYVLGAAEDYQRYIDLLDGDYGASRRTAEKGCALRYWTAGQVSIVGRHCSGGETRLTFYNEVVADQLSQNVDKEKADQAKSGKKPDRPTIDRDNL